MHTQKDKKKLNDDSSEKEDWRADQKTKQDETRGKCKCRVFLFFGPGVR